MHVKATKRKDSIYIVVSRSIYNPETKKSKTIVLYYATATEFKEVEFKRSIKESGVTVGDNELSKAKTKIQNAIREDARLKLSAALKLIKKSGTNSAISKLIASLTSQQ